jgi:hypothetical protein
MVDAVTFDVTFDADGINFYLRLGAVGNDLFQLEPPKEIKSVI